MHLGNGKAHPWGFWNLAFTGRNSGGARVPASEEGARAGHWVWKRCPQSAARMTNWNSTPAERKSPTPSCLAIAWHTCLQNLTRSLLAKEKYGFQCSATTSQSRLYNFGFAPERKELKTYNSSHSFNRYVADACFVQNTFQGLGINQWRKIKKRYLPSQRQKGQITYRGLWLNVSHNNCLIQFWKDTGPPRIVPPTMMEE